MRTISLLTMIETHPDKKISVETTRVFALQHKYHASTMQYLVAQCKIERKLKNAKHQKFFPQYMGSDRCSADRTCG